MNLSEISFGDRVAENEAQTLANYFVQTQPWDRLYSGEIDIVFGSKGAGKSALYTLLLNKATNLKERNIFLISVEKPTGKTVFSDITMEPPTSEQEFVTLWKIYFCQLIVKWLLENDLCKGTAETVAAELKKVDLLEEKNTLKHLVNRAKEFARKLIHIESVEGGMGTEGVTGKITFRTPTRELQKKGYKSVDDLLDDLNEYLEEIGQTCWILCDRLDVAFDQNTDLEKNALKALFKTYRDIEEYKAIHLKVFLRDDIWNRITKDGFREASHITKTVNITWNTRSLLHLIVSRALENKVIIDKYGINKDEILSDHVKQNEFYYKMFPKQVDIGEKQSNTFDWILSRIRDGLNNTPPRELIHYYNESVTQEIKEQEINNDKIEEPNIVSRLAIKNAAYEVSKVRTEQTIFAEYPNLRKYIEDLENKKAEHTLSTLSEVWNINENKAKNIANKLAEVGFFDLKSAKNDQIYKIPFFYRFYLHIVQGKAYS